MKKAFLCLLCLTAAIPLSAEKTRSWRQSDFEDFEKGEADRVTLHSSGRITLAPRVERLFDATASYLWDLAVDAEGNVFAAAGPEARILRLGADGSKTVFFETDAVEIHALAVGAGGVLYAATSPDAQVYKLDASGGYELFYDPEAAYVWDMAVGPDGGLYIATGDEGKIHRVEPSGDGGVFFETDETHVRSLGFDGAGNLIVGTDPSGLVMRVTATSEGARGFVLYQSPKKEMTAVAAAEDGTIYAAGVGARTAVPAVIRQAQRQAAQSAAQGAPQQGQQALQPTPAPAAVALRVQGGSSIVRIAPDGAPLEMWSDDRAVVYSLGFDGEGRLLAGTGDDGRLVRVENEHEWALVTTFESNQVTAITTGPDGRTLLGLSNVGALVGLGPGVAEEGEFVSEVLDAEHFARMGRLEAASEGEVAVTARAGNLDRPLNNWSEWSESELPGARYAQWRAQLKGEDARVDAVTLYYRPANRAPEIEAIEATPANFAFPPRRTTSGPETMTLPALGMRASARSTGAQTAPQTMVFEQGAYGVRWSAEDPNEDDEVRARVEIQGDAESAWILLEEGIDDTRFSFDSTAFADGVYRLRVTVSDAVSNAEGEGLETARMTEPFVIDNGQPVVEELSAVREGERLRVTFQAVDQTSKIAAAEYSVDGGEWTAVEPESGLFDGLEAGFSFLTGEVGDGERVLAVRVRDERRNQAAAKVGVR